MERPPPTYIVHGYDALTYAYNSRPLDDHEIAEARFLSVPIDMDISIPSGCLNNCDYCGYRDRPGRELSQEQIFSLIDEFAGMGGKSIRIVGEGEPLLRTDLLKILERMNEMGLVPVVFTCGDVLGSDELARKIHGMSAWNLVKRLLELNTTIMLKYDSLSEADKITKREGYTKMRDNALEKLLLAGFTKFNPTHLGFGVVVTSRNIIELPKIYDFALKNNIYFLGCYLMPIGRAEKEEKRFLIQPSAVAVKEVSASLYKIAYDYGVRELFDVKLVPPSTQFPLGFEMTFNGPNDFAGARKCAIATSGLFVDCTGDIKLCEALPAIGRFPEKRLAAAWKEAALLNDEKYGACRSTGKCQMKRETGILPKDFDEAVRSEVQQYMRENPQAWRSRKINSGLLKFFNRHPEKLVPQRKLLLAH